MQQRRKTVYAMKQAALGAGVAAARRSGAPLSMAATVFALFVLATFLYNEDIKSIADFPFGAGALRAKSPDLHLLQEAEAAAHHAVTTLAMRGEEAIVRVLDAPRHADIGIGINRTGDPVPKMVINAKVGTGGGGNGEELAEEKDRDVTLPRVAAMLGGGGAEEARRREDEEEAAEKASTEKAKAAALVTIRSVETCDLYQGEWVYDEVNAPVYKEAQCEFLTEQVTCMRNGRRDDSYQRWRWQPSSCDLPRSLNRIEARIYSKSDLKILKKKGFLRGFLAGSTRGRCWSGCGGSG